MRADLFSRRPRPSVSHHDAFKHKWQGGPDGGYEGQTHLFFNKIRGWWRRRRDSNPRDGFPPAPLAGVCLRPLGHVSAGVSMQALRGKQGRKPFRCRKAVEDLYVSSQQPSGSLASSSRLAVSACLGALERGNGKRQAAFGGGLVRCLRSGLLPSPQSLRTRPAGPDRLSQGRTVASRARNIS